MNTTGYVVCYLPGAGGWSAVKNKIKTQKQENKNNNNNGGGGGDDGVAQDGSHTANRAFQTTKTSVAFQVAPKHIFLESFQIYTEIFRDKIRHVR